MLKESELDTSTYPGQKSSFVGKKKVSSEDDKRNEDTGSKLFQDGHTAVYDSGVKGSAMHLKEGHSAVAQSKKNASYMKEKIMAGKKTENVPDLSHKNKMRSRRIHSCWVMLMNLPYQ